MDKKLLALMTLFVLAFIIFLSFILFNDQIVGATQASNKQVSATNSLLFAWPLEVQADSESISEITVFVRTDEGQAVPDRIVQLSTNVGTISEDSVVTDTSGKAVFTLSSAVPGIAQVQAVVEGIQLQRTVSIQFSQ